MALIALGLVRIRRFVVVLLLLLLEVGRVDAVDPLADEDLAVGSTILALAMRFAVLPLAFVEAAVRRIIAAAAVLHAVLPIALVLAAFGFAQHAVSLGPAHGDMALITVVFLAVEEPLHHAVAICVAVLARAAP